MTEVEARADGAEFGPFRQAGLGFLRLGWLILLGLGVSPVVRAAGVLGVVDAYQAALMNDPDYQFAVSDYDAGREAQKVGRAALLPSLSTSGSFFRNNSDITTDSVFDGGQVTNKNIYPSAVFSVQLRQPIFDLEGFARYQQGRAQTRSSDALFAARSQETMVRVVGLYVAAVYEEDQLLIALAQRDMDKQAFASSVRLLDKGEGRRTDRLEAEAQFYLSEAKIFQAEKRLEEARYTLSGLVGAEVTALQTLVKNFRVKPSEAVNFDDLRAMMLEFNGEVAAKRYLVEVARQEIKRARAEHFPRLEAVASFSKTKSETISTLNEDIQSETIGLQMNFPLYAGGSINARTRQAEANHSRAKADLEATINKISVDMKKQYTVLNTSGALISALEKSLLAGEVQLAAMQAGMLLGVNTYHDVLDAQVKMFTTKRDLSLARYGYLVGYLRFRQDAGTLSGEDLQVVAAYFTPVG